MKKLTGMLIAALTVFSAFNAYADAFWISPVDTEVRYDGTALISDTTFDDGTSGVTLKGNGQTGIARFHIPGTMESSSKFKNNFDYTFDFKFNADHHLVKFTIADKVIGFMKYRTTDTYYITVDESPVFPEAAKIHDDGTRLDGGKWYTMRICGDMQTPNGDIYISLTDPGTDEVKETVTKHSFSNTLKEWVDNNNFKNYSMSWSSYDSADMSLRNEKFVMERFFADVPEMTLEDNKVKLSETVYNSFIQTGNAPKLEIAVYNSDMLMTAYAEKSDTEAVRFEGLVITPAANSLELDMSAMADGTYTVKGYVTDSAGGGLPYYAPVVKTVKVTDGEALEVTE